MHLLQCRELKTKYQDSLLDNKRLQDRFDSLEFYAKTNTNSSVFHNLIPSTYYPNGSAKSSSGDDNSSNGPALSLNTSRSRTPAPALTPRPRIPVSASASLSSSSTSSTGNYSLNSSLPSGSYESSTPSYFNRSSSRQSSVERSTAAYPYEFTTRSRNSSPSRTFDMPSSLSSSDRGRSSVLAGLPPHPTSFHYDSYSLRNRREPSAERFAQLRNRREASQERALRPSASSSYLTNRRSSVGYKYWTWTDCGFLLAYFFFFKYE